ncbi:Ras GTPase activation domain-containing protein [Planoprotostelium fungivorum]|uniref:Ras GTPase activation domain-containing protein n=1 Tax=Planoprotostelium fungivorum TaxID=1890364 RepID=A0A2P6NYC1_9EUKA|nr:Ras GTPase activation domain-containing protein [Planoprotostelium fungivorum]
MSTLHQSFIVYLSLTGLPLTGSFEDSFVVRPITMSYVYKHTQRDPGFRAAQSANGPAHVHTAGERSTQPQLEFPQDLVIGTKDGYYLVSKFYSGIMTSAIGDCIDVCDQDTFAHILLTLSEGGGFSLQLARRLLSKEISHIDEDGKGAALRGNNLCSRFEAVYLRSIGTDYVKTLLLPLIKSVVRDEGLDLEVDPIKCPSVEEQNKNCMELIQKADTFLDRILHPESLNSMPREIRAVADWIYREVRDQFREDSINIVAGFIMLRDRYICSAIVLPESWSIPAGVVSPKARRNLVLIAKVIQNISNSRTEQKKKEDYMEQLRDFTDANRLRMGSYLMRVCSDPTDLTGLDPWRDLEQSRRNPVAVQASVDVQTLFALHKLLYLYKEKVLEAVKQVSNGKPEIEEKAQDFINVLEALCHSPEDRNRIQKGASLKGSKETKILVDPSAEDPELLASMQAAKFLYPGGPDKTGTPVFYVILSRMKPEFREEEAMSTLARYIRSTMDGVVLKSPYSIVADVGTSSGTWRRYVQHLVFNLFGVLDRRYKKNIQNLWIVHPSVLSSAIINLASSVVSKKTRRKIKNVYQWKDLTKYIDPQDINLPDKSRIYITRCVFPLCSLMTQDRYYSVVKVNHKGKRQQRVIKFTRNSILNIDEHQIQNEKPLSSIRRIIAPNDTAELLLQFEPPISKSPRRHTARFNFKAVSEDALIRRYIFPSQHDRGELLKDIFTIAYQYGLFIESQTFRITKINPVGKRQDRVLKFTVDSLLNLDDGGRIHSEFSYSSIESAVADAHGHIVWKLRDGPKLRKLLCKNLSETQLLLRTFTEAITVHELEVRKEDRELRKGSIPL